MTPIRPRHVVLPLVVAATLASGCSLLPGNAAQIASTALAVAKLFDGQLLPPPKLLSDKLIPVFVSSLATGKAPDLDMIVKALSITNGSQIGTLPDRPGNPKLEVPVASYRHAFGLLGDDRVFRVKQGYEEQTVGLGLASPSVELAYARNNPALFDDAPIFAASDGYRRYRLSQASGGVDLRPQMPPVRNQGERGTCVLFATAGHMDYLNGKAGLPIKSASPQQMNWLYNVVVKSKTEPATLWNDQGTISTKFYPLLRLEGNREVSADSPYVPPQLGYVSESDAPYKEDQKAQPPSSDFAAMARLNLGQAVASKIEAGQRLQAQGAYYFRIKNDDASWEAALDNGNPIQVGFPICAEDWMEIDDPYIADFNDSKENVGYHATLVVGYRRDARASGGGWYIVRNSWGPDWGEKGYCYVSYGMARKYALNPHIANTYKAPFSAKFPIAPPPKDPPPVDQVRADAQLPSDSEINGYTEEDQKNGKSLADLIDLGLDTLISILEGKR